MSQDPTLVAPPDGAGTGADAGADPAPEPRVSPDVRQRLVRQIERWVDRMLAGEPPPPGLPAELLEEFEPAATPAPPAAPQPACDLYTLFAGLTTLTGEIRLQGRAFKQLTDTLAPLADVPRQLAHLEETLTDDPARGADELPVSGDDVCEVMLDLYDRLERGLRTCDQALASLRRPKPGRLRQWMGLAAPGDRASASAEAIRDTTALTLARLESVLHDWGVERVGRVGEPFDPSRMTAVHVRPDPDAEPATVLEVNRSGYALHGHLKLTAQVTVARADSISDLD